MNYQQLFDSIESYTENNFPAFDLSNGSQDTTTEQINRFIQQAEQRIYNTVQFPSLRKNMVGTTSTNNKYVAAPTDFLAADRVVTYDFARLMQGAKQVSSSGFGQAMIERIISRRPNKKGRSRGPFQFNPAISGNQTFWIFEACLPHWDPAQRRS